jgi:hypothetical protein
VREVGKAMGLTEDTIDALSSPDLGLVDDGARGGTLREIGPRPRRPAPAQTLA